MTSNRASILIVDDEPINLDIICAHLEDENYELVRATNGHEAWSKLEADPTLYDTIILDRTMPGMDGMQLLNNIKESDELERVPVIMQTAKAATSDVVAGLKAGASYYLTKPYDGEILKSVIRGAVSGRLHEKSLLESLREGRKIFDLMTFGRFRIHNLHQCNLSVIRDHHYKYVHFGALPPLFFDLEQDPGEFVNQAQNPKYQVLVLEYAQKMLSLKMNHAERGLTEIMLGEGGAVTRRAPPRKLAS